MSAAGRQRGVPPLLKVTFPTTSGESQSLRFRLSFRIGRLEDCEVCIKDDYVSRYHAEVVFVDNEWVIKDLGSANGLFMNGERVAQAPVGQSSAVRLGLYGPEVVLQVEPTAAEGRVPPPSSASGTTVARYIEHYFGKSQTILRSANTRCTCAEPFDMFRPNNGASMDGSSVV